MAAKGNVQPLSVTVVDEISGRALSATVARLGGDLVVAVGGGDRPHVGVTVVAQPWPSRSRPGAVSASCSLLTIPPHKEEAVARALAVRLCEATGGVVVVAAGIHEDSLDPAGIDDYARLAERLGEALVTSLAAAS